MHCPSHTFYFKHCALMKAVSYGMYVKDRLAISSIICVQGVDGGSSELLSKKKQKAAILKKCPNSIIKGVCECALNLLQGNIPITVRQNSRLTPYKKLYVDWEIRKCLCLRKDDFLLKKKKVSYLYLFLLQYQFLAH